MQPGPPQRRPQAGQKLLFGVVSLKDIAVCALFAFPCALLYRLVLLPFLANLDFVRSAKARGFPKLLDDFVGFLGLDLEGKDPNSWSGWFSNKVARCLDWLAWCECLTTVLVLQLHAGMLALAKFVLSSGWPAIVLLVVVFIVFLACLEPMLNAAFACCGLCCRRVRIRKRSPEELERDRINAELDQLTAEVDDVLAELTAEMTPEEREDWARQEAQMEEEAKKRAPPVGSVYRPPGSALNRQSGTAATGTSDVRTAAAPAAAPAPAASDGTPADKPTGSPSLRQRRRKD